MKTNDYYLKCIDHAQELYWRTLGELRNMKIIKQDIEYTLSSNENGPERIYKVTITSNDLEERLNQIVANIKAKKAPDSFLISPMSKPANIIDLLEERGFIKDDSGACMSMELNDFIAREVSSDSIRVEEVTTDGMLNEWIEIINTELFECEVLSFEQFKDLIALGYSRFFIGYYDDAPASICLTLSDGKLADLTWVATKKEFRKKGLGELIVNKALSELKEIGVETVSLRADPMAIRLYEKVGFKEYFKRVVMKCDYSQVYKKTCCKMDQYTIDKTKAIFNTTDNITSYINEMDKQSVIGRKISYDSSSKEIYLTKRHADECGGGCLTNKTMIGKRCHCGYMNHSTELLSIDYCICSAEFFRPMFEPLLGDNLEILPVETVLSGGKECTFVIRNFDE